MSVLSVLSGLSTAAGKGFAGYAEDEQTSVRNAMAQAKAKQDAERDRVLNLVSQAGINPKIQGELAGAKAMAEIPASVEKVRLTAPIQTQAAIVTHAGTRKIDVDNPLPVAPSFSTENIDGKVTSVDNRTGQKGTVLGTAGQTPAQAAAAGARIGAREDRLQQNFQGDPAVKQGALIANAVAQLRAASQEKTPQGDLSMIYGAVKLRDPNSAVREGEIDLQRAARSVGTQMVGLWNKVKSGRMLTDMERQQIMDVVDQTVAQQSKLVDPVMARFGKQARGVGADSAYVAPDPMGAVKKATPPPSRPTQAQYDAARLIHTDADLAKHYDLTGLTRRP